MNDNTFVGNVSHIEGYRTTRSGDAELTFTIKIDNGYYDSQNRWISDTVTQKVVAYRRLAENLQTTFATHEKNGVGVRVIIIGKLRDDSYIPAGRDHRVNRTKLVASAGGADLSFATAVITKTGKTTTERGNERNREQLTTPVAVAA
ncbi:hypothetical protein CFP71_40520 [Amycolatopsis thailandensis]|uniref:Single-stranded DNA-binding protein n=1 Tax=Amycolatopsis thailandensis TaxID=589330 RepID=A0A229RCR8_9PSEU|nr:single-stranded DNA-binding protein [Amycolatopsis thailandensis]OXM44241.1 hypothetical protein CFP71_40520 [Amycolatopsis thailandensis]